MKKNTKEILSLNELKALLKGTKRDNYNHGYKIHAYVNNVSRSGMSRTMEFYIIKNNKYIDVTQLISNITGYEMKNGYLFVRGCGMDMIFKVIIDLNYKAMELDDYKGKKRRYDNYLLSGSYN